MTYFMFCSSSRKSCWWKEDGFFQNQPCWPAAPVCSYVDVLRNQTDRWLAVSMSLLETWNKTCYFESHKECFNFKITIFERWKVILSTGAGGIVWLYYCKKFCGWFYFNIQHKKKKKMTSLHTSLGSCPDFESSAVNSNHCKYLT